MRPATALLALSFSGSAWAEESARFERVAVVIGIDQPTDDVPRLERAEESVLELADTLSGSAGYPKVITLVGEAATAAGVEAALGSGLGQTSDDGTLLVVYVGHGAGGDYGEPALLTAGAVLSDPVGTGLSVDALSAALRPRTAEQSIVVILDAAHEGGVGGVALIGPAAVDWPSLPEWGLAVTTKAAGTAGREGVLVSSMRAGIAGSADANTDGHVTISELSRFIDSRVGAGGDLALERGGAVAANLIVSDVSTAPAPAPAPAPVPVSIPVSTPTRDPGPDPVFKLKPVAVAVGAVGAAAVITSLTMYLAKKNGCEDIDGQLTCGDDAGYRQFRTTQHALGWVGGGLVLAGVGVQFIPAPQGAMVGVVGSF